VQWLEEIPLRDASGVAKVAAAPVKKSKKAKKTD
jgi:hypothetical protein